MTRINALPIPTLGNAELQGDIFYVDGNRPNDGGSGKSWADAFQKLATGLAAAHADIGRTADRQWAGRNTVYVKGDAITENLTKFAEKTDVVGVGSTNQHTHTRIDGTHVLEATTSDTYHGCRFFNIEFYGSSAAPIVTIPADQNGIVFCDCKFSSVDSATIGILATQSHDMKIVRCVFDPDTTGAGFSTAAIQIAAGSVTNFLLQDCRIYSGAIGLDFNPTAAQAINCWVIDNVMRTTGIGIDSESDNATSLICIGNRMVTLVDTGTYTNGFDFVEAQAIDNIVTGSGGETDITPLPETTAN